MISNKVGFIGGGNMARAIAGGLLRGGMHATDILISEPDTKQRDLLREALHGALVSEDNAAVAAATDVVLFAVKPQILPTVCAALDSVVQETRPLIMSIAAGPRIDDIDGWLGGDLSVVRVMPNQPALIDQGISALFANSRTSGGQRELAERIMAAVGQIVWLKNEAEMDAVTAISGTGPAYFYLLIDILIRSAMAFGLDAEIARTLAIETARGATALASAESESMSAMIDRVRSPGGTTTAALEHLDKTNTRGIFADAIEAARKRAVELGEEASSMTPQKGN